MLLLSKMLWCQGEDLMMSRVVLAYHLWGSHGEKVTSTNAGETPKIKLCLHLLEANLHWLCVPIYKLVLMAVPTLEL